MTLENKHRADNKTLREFYEATGSKGVLWIDHRTGRIVELPVESRIRRGEGGCQLCHEQFVGMEKHGRVDFDERNYRASYSDRARRNLHRLRRVGALAPSLRRT